MPYMLGYILLELVKWFAGIKEKVPVLETRLTLINFEDLVVQIVFVMRSHLVVVWTSYNQTQNGKVYLSLP